MLLLLVSCSKDRNNTSVVNNCTSDIELAWTTVYDEVYPLGSLGINIYYRLEEQTVPDQIDIGVSTGSYTFNPSLITSCDSVYFSVSAYSIENPTLISVLSSEVLLKR